MIRNHSLTFVTVAHSLVAFKTFIQIIWRLIPYYNSMSTSWITGGSVTCTVTTRTPTWSSANMTSIFCLVLCQLFLMLNLRIWLWFDWFLVSFTIVVLYFLVPI